MRRIPNPKTRPELRARRKLRIRKNVSGSAERPRLVVFRSLKHIYAQLVDDVARRTIATASDASVGVKPRDRTEQPACSAFDRNASSCTRAR